MPVDPANWRAITWNLRAMCRMDGALYYRKQEIFRSNQSLAVVELYEIFWTIATLPAHKTSEKSSIPGAPLTVIGCCEIGI